MKNIFTKLTFALFCLILFVPANAQISEGGIPPGMNGVGAKSAVVPTYEMPVDFDVAKLLEEDILLAEDNMPPRCGVVMPLSMNLIEHGTKISLPDGQEIIQLKIEANDALAIMLLYDKFIIPKGGKLFIYNSERNHILGAFTSKTNPAGRSFATEFLLGDKVVMEYVIPQTGELPQIEISGLSYGYNHLPDNGVRKDRGTSGSCEVNVNCPEGDNWQDEKRGIAKVIMILNGYSSCCSGTMVNNTAQDFDPLYLSAHHCFESVTPADMDKMVFYFNYELPGCEVDGLIDPDVPTIVGAQYVADINYTGGSDGALLRLNENVPAEWNIFFNGWDRRNERSVSGVGIHHPNGDIKKISTYTAAPTSSTWPLGGAPEAHWEVKYAKTESGWGVTEGGSSGSPLFNQDKRVIGTLTGSNYSATVNGQIMPCYNLADGMAFYGKLWYHWDQAYQKMKNYLDPLNTGVEVFDGAYVDYRTFLADFEMPTAQIYLTQKLDIKNKSRGARSWNWSFPGADIETSTDEIPPVITYNTQGTYTVTLTINKGEEDESTKSITFDVYRKENLCPEQVVVGTNTSLVSQYPLGSNFRQIISASIYTADEIGLQEESIIESLSWYATYKDGPERMIQIYLKEVDENAFDEASLWESEIDGALMVFQSPDNWKVSSSGWNKFDLSKPFHYSGKKNLKVMVRSVTTNYGNYKDASCAYTIAEKKHQTWNDEYYVAPILNPGAVGNLRPNIRINAGVLCGIEQPTADFTVDGSNEENVQISTGEEITFVSQTTGPVVNFEWTFEGANPATSLKENPVVVYTEPGTYSATLKASNTAGEITKTKTLTVIIQPPVADFTATSTGIYTYPDFNISLPYQGGDVVFYDKSKHTPSTWSWNLADAEPQTATEQNVNAYYPAQKEAKISPVVLSVTNNGGSDELTKEEFVKVGGTAAIWNLPNGDKAESYFTSSEGNYLTGTNKDFSSIAEKFESHYPGTIDKVYLKMKAMEGNVSTQAYSVAIYSDKNGLPDKNIKAKSFNGKNINADGHTTVTFDQAVEVSGTFYVVIGGLTQSDKKVAVASTAKSKETVYIRESNKWKKLSDFYGEEWSISLNVAPNFTYAIPADGAPFDLKVAYDKEENKISLDWKNNIWEEDELLYSKVYRNGTEIATNVMGTSFEDTSFPTGSNVCYAVSAVYKTSAPWESAKSIDACVYIDDVNINNINDEQAIEVYPNPVNDELNIRSQNTILSVAVYSIHGEKILSLLNDNKEMKLPLSNLNQGIYILKISTTEGTNTLKIVKN